MRSQLSQAVLDNLAVAWSRLDRARPRREADVPDLLCALDEWVRWAVRVDDELTGALGAPYAARRAEQPRAHALGGLRHAYDLTGRLGHPIDSLVTVSAGSPAIFYDVTWRPPEELPDAEGPADVVEAYRLHLASRPARVPASGVTTFLLSAAVTDDD
ncbi:MAG TPA: hypothetical protein VOB72_24535 [Candidatus Dormibacteraeota bacterium]|nr:hypothetical protein [Candidatus Dormibacteraeota bacterium]